MPACRPGTLRLLACIAVVASCLLRPAPAVGESDGQHRDDAEPVAIAAADFLRAFDNLDWEAFLASWSDDPSVFFPFADTPERVTGRASVEARFRRFFDETRLREAGPPYLHLEPRELRVERHGDAGLVTFMLGGGGERLGRRTLLFVRENGAWRLKHLHASNMEP